MKTQMTTRKRTWDTILTRLMATLLVAALGASSTGVALAAPGDLDPTFGDNGKVVTDFGDEVFGVEDGISAIAFQPDGKIVVAGYTLVNDDGDFALARYDSEGNLDLAFGINGLVTTDFAGGENRGHAVVTQSDGMIIVAGETTIGGDSDFSLARYDGDDGSLDPTFGSGGLVTTDFPSGLSRGYAIALQSDGKIVVAGYISTVWDLDFALARYDGDDGSLDSTFGTGGLVTTDFAGGDDRGYAIALQPNGKIVVAGRVGGRFGIARYSGDDGGLDLTFGTGGLVITDFGFDGIDLGRAIALQPDGMIIVAGETTIGGDSDFALARYGGDDGSLDCTFGGDGLVTTDFGDDDSGRAIALQPDGKIVVTGSSGHGYFALARYDGDDGSLDPTFGSGGLVLTDFFESGPAKGTAIALQGDKIVVAGQVYFYLTLSRDFVLVRYDDGALPDTFIVNTTLDENDGSCDDGDCSLRDAMLLANTDPDPNTINFLIPGDSVHTIQPASALPTLSDGDTTIDGYSQPGAVEATDTTSATLRIEIDGALAGICNGFAITSTNNTIEGLVINRFAVNGIAIVGTTATQNRVLGNHIGTDASGTADLGNGYNGVFIGQSAWNNVVGNTASGRNVISGNGWEGVGIHGADTYSNSVLANYIGVTANGTEALSNTLHGVRVYGGAFDNHIQDNVISGNGKDGIRIFGDGTAGNMVVGNYIGTDVNGSYAVPNTTGIHIEAGYNTIGGDAEEERNVVSGNSQSGIVISGTNTMSNTVSGNYIGTDASGTADMGNSRHGVYIYSGAHHNIVGGDTEGERNVISGNDQDGISIDGSATAGNIVSGNYIGTDESGTADLGNARHGVYITTDAQNNTIGGDTEGERNVISGNDASGVSINGSGVKSNTVSGNYIGTDESGMADLGNSSGGIFIGFGAQNNTIGGNTEGKGNIISGNDQDGVWIYGIDTTGNIVSGYLLNNPGKYTKGPRVPQINDYSRQ